MGDDQKHRAQQTHHIRAARDWLDEADASLTEGSGIKGDLKVMLAQAELQRAKETELLGRGQRLRRWAWRILPLTAAAAFIALAFFLTPAVAPPETAGIQQRPTEVEDATRAFSEEERTAASVVPPKASEASEEAGQASEAAAGMDPAAAIDARSASTTTQQGVELSASEQKADAPKEPTVDVPQAASAPKVPAPETQKLMQSAGKVLREP